MFSKIFTGQEEYSRLRPLSYANTNVFLLTASLANPVSFENITDKWVPELRHYSPDVPIVIVGTKMDLERKVEKRKGEEIAKKIGGFYLECSSLTGEGLKEVFDTAVKVTLSKKVLNSFFFF